MTSAGNFTYTVQVQTGQAENSVKDLNKSAKRLDRTFKDLKDVEGIDRRQFAGAQKDVKILSGQISGMAGKMLRLQRQLKSTEGAEGVKAITNQMGHLAKEMELANRQLEHYKRKHDDIARNAKRRLDGQIAGEFGGKEGSPVNARSFQGDLWRAKEQAKRLAESAKDVQLRFSDVEGEGRQIVHSIVKMRNEAESARRAISKWSNKTDDLVRDLELGELTQAEFNRELVKTNRLLKNEERILNRITRELKEQEKAGVSKGKIVSRGASGGGAFVKSGPGGAKFGGIFQGRVGEAMGSLAKFNIYAFMVDRFLETLRRVPVALWNIGKAGAQLDNLRTAFERMSKISETSLAKIQTALNNTVSKRKIYELSNLSRQIGVAGKDIPKLAAIAKAAGQNIGKSTEEMYRDIATGAARKSRRVLDNLGIGIEHLSVVYKKYAEERGIASAEMTKEMKDEAFMQELLSRSSIILESAGKSATDVYEQQEARMQDLIDSAGEFINKSMQEAGVFDMLSDTLSSLEGVIETFKPAIDDLIPIVLGFVEGLKNGLTGSLAAVMGALQALKPVLILISVNMKALGLGTKMVGFALGAIGNVLDLVLGPLEDVLGYVGKLVSLMDEAAGVIKDRFVIVLEEMGLGLDLSSEKIADFSDTVQNLAQNKAIELSNIIDIDATIGREIGEDLSPVITNLELFRERVDALNSTPEKTDDSLSGRILSMADDTFASAKKLSRANKVLYEAIQEARRYKEILNSSTFEEAGTTVSKDSYSESHRRGLNAEGGLASTVINSMIQNLELEEGELKPKMAQLAKKMSDLSDTIAYGFSTGSESLKEAAKESKKEAKEAFESLDSELWRKGTDFIAKYADEVYGASQSISYLQDGYHTLFMRIVEGTKQLTVLTAAMNELEAGTREFAVASVAVVQTTVAVEQTKQAFAKLSEVLAKLEEDQKNRGGRKRKTRADSIWPMYAKEIRTIGDEMGAVNDSMLSLRTGELESIVSNAIALKNDFRDVDVSLNELNKSALEMIKEAAGDKYYKVLDKSLKPLYSSIVEGFGDQLKRSKKELASLQVKDNLRELTDSLRSELTVDFGNRKIYQEEKRKIDEWKGQKMASLEKARESIKELTEFMPDIESELDEYASAINAVSSRRNEVAFRALLQAERDRADSEFGEMSKDGLGYLMAAKKSLKAWSDKAPRDDVDEAFNDQMISNLSEKVKALSDQFTQDLESAAASGIQSFADPLSYSLDRLFNTAIYKMQDFKQIMGASSKQMIESAGQALGTYLGAQYGMGDLGGSVVGTIFSGVGTFVDKLINRDREKDKMIANEIKALGENNKKIVAYTTVIHQGLDMSERSIQQVNEAVTRGIEIGYYND